MDTNAGLPGDDAQVLSGLNKDRWDAVRASGSEIGEAISEGDAEGAQAALSAMLQVPLDREAVLNSIHIPDDAGEYAPALEQLMRRIPDNWGRWISCNKGWYPLLVRLDGELAAIAPDYELHQAKEKFGTLRFYVGLPHLEPDCCKELDVSDPRPHPGAVNGPWAPKGRSEQAQAEMDAWHERISAHIETVECRQADEALEPARQEQRERLRQMEEIISRYEAESATVCEECGSSGAALGVRRYWYKTVCPACADKLGFYAIDGEEEE